MVASNSAMASSLAGSAATAAAYSSIALLPTGLNTWPAWRARRASSSNAATSAAGSSSASAPKSKSASVIDGVPVSGSMSCAVSSEPPDIQKTPAMTTTATTAAMPRTFGLRSAEPPVLPPVPSLSRKSAADCGGLASAPSERFVPTPLRIPETVRAKRESSSPNALARPSSMGDPACICPSGGSAGAGVGLGAGLLAAAGLGAGAGAGFGAAGCTGFGAGLGTGFGAGCGAAFGAGFGAAFGVAF